MNQNVTRWAFLIVPAARAARLAPSLLAGLIHCESAGDPQAISKAGAVGLCQVMPAEAIPGRPTSEQLRDPALNVEWGVRLLVEARDWTHTQAGMLAAYFGAVGNDGRPNSASDGSGVDGWGYVRAVEAAALEYQALDQHADKDYVHYAPLSGQWREVATNLKGVCDDALAAGRRLKADLEMTADAAKRSADRWGNR